MEEREIGAVDHFFGNISVGMIKLNDVLKVGDRIRIKGKSCDFSQDITSMQINRVPAEEGKAGDVISVKVEQKVHQGDKVYKNV